MKKNIPPDVEIPPKIVEVDTLQPRGLKIKQASAYSGLTIWAIRELIRNRKIEFLQVGKGYVILRDDLDRFLERERYKIRT